MPKKSCYLKLHCARCTNHRQLLVPIASTSPKQYMSKIQAMIMESVKPENPELKNN